MREVNRPRSAAFMTLIEAAAGSPARGPASTTASAVCGEPGLSTSTTPAPVARPAPPAPPDAVRGLRRAGLVDQRDARAGRAHGLRGPRGRGRGGLLPAAEQRIGQAA